MNPATITGTRKTLAVILGLVLLFVVWEYAPPVWGGMLLIILTVLLAMKALKTSPNHGATGTF
jgi:membrane-bound ClpP family serine protease